MKLVDLVMRARDFKPMLNLAVFDLIPGPDQRWKIRFWMPPDFQRHANEGFVLIHSFI
jgi:hypothetical protein